MKHYGLQDMGRTQQIVQNTIVFGYFGRIVSEKMARLQNFSFGLSQDGGYNKTEVLTW